VAGLEGARVGAYALRVGRLQPMAKSGWARFELVLVSDAGDLEPAVAVGIHSRGGRGVLPWIEVLRYRSRLARGGETVDLVEQGWDVELFRRLGELIPPGGHLMVACEDDGHAGIYRTLMHGAPPETTPLGSALVKAGFPRVRFFYLAEGGHEGPQKLWAEKPAQESG
jgi:hypothetical protein